MKKFLERVAFASEKAACVARACRKETDLFKLLVQVRPPLAMTVPVKFILYLPFHPVGKRDRRC